jgi:hypothetical protein
MVTKRRGGLATILVLTLACVAVIGLRAAGPERVYTVAEVQRGLATHPQQWIGRTVLVRGVFLVSMSDPGVIDVFHPPPYILVTYTLYQPGPARTGGISGLPLTLKLAPHLAPARTNPLADVLRRVPWLQRLLGAPGVPVLRVTLLAPPAGGCAGPVCPDGQLDERPW